MSILKTALVAGGTGSIGEGIVKILIEGGYKVFVPFRPMDQTERLLAYAKPAAASDLVLLPCDLSDISAVAAARKKVSQEVEELDLVVTAVGSSYYGYSLHRIPPQDWDRLLTENLRTHFNLQHEFLSLLHEQKKGVYVVLNGPEANFVQPESGLMSIIAAAKKMMARVASQEAFSTGVRVYSVTSNTPVATRSRGEQISPEWITAEELGLYIRFLNESRVEGLDEVQHELSSRKQINYFLAHR